VLGRHSPLLALQRYREESSHPAARRRGVRRPGGPDHVIIILPAPVPAIAGGAAARTRGSLPSFPPSYRPSPFVSSATVAPGRSCQHPRWPRPPHATKSKSRRRRGRRSVLCEAKSKAPSSNTARGDRASFPSSPSLFIYLLTGTEG